MSMPGRPFGRRDVRVLLPAILFGLLLLQSCTTSTDSSENPLPPEVVEELVVTELSDYPDFGEIGTGYWLARARRGDFGTYELELGFGPGHRVMENHWWVKEVFYPFSLTYNVVTLKAVFTFGLLGDRKTLEYEVGSAGDKAALVVKCPRWGRVEVADLVLNGEDVTSPDFSAGNDTGEEFRYFLFEGIDLSGGFVLTGSVSFDWQCISSDNCPAVELLVTR
jgi:hypothetical protein